MSCEASCFPEKDEGLCHYTWRNNMFVQNLCAADDDNRSCTRRVCALLLPFSFMYWLSIVEDVSSWTENDGWHMTLYSMLVLSCEMTCLVVITKIYQCLVIGCCKADETKTATDETETGCATIMTTIWVLLTNLEVFVTIGMIVAGVVATFHIRNQLSESDGTVYKHGELLEKRLLQQFLPIVLIFVFVLDFLLNCCIFTMGKCCCTKGKAGPEKKSLIDSEA